MEVEKKKRTVKKKSERLWLLQESFHLGRQVRRGATWRRSRLSCFTAGCVCVGRGLEQADEKREKFSAGKWEEPGMATTSKVKITV